MKPLDEELVVEEIFDKIKKVFPDVTTPDIGNVHFIESFRFDGLANIYHIKLNLSMFEDISIQNKRLVHVVLHELVHYNGFMHHKESFYNKLEILERGWSEAYEELTTNNKTSVEGE